MMHIVMPYLLWSIVGFRLICPFSFESMFSLLQADSIVPITSEWTGAGGWYQASAASPANSQTELWKDLPDNLDISQTIAAKAPWQIGLAVTAGIWLGGIFILITYSIFSLQKLKKRIRQQAVPGASCRCSRKAKQWDIPVWVIDGLETPFVLGLFKTVIYLPAHLTKDQKTYCLAHECTHIRRGDPFIKQLAFLLTCIHWFNPFVWAAFYFMTKDMEMSCDESVIRNGNITDKKAYSYTLLSLASEKRFALGSHIGFGETSIKIRVHNILNYKKPAFWISFLCLGLVGALTVGLMTNPKTASANEPKIFAESLSEGRRDPLYAQVNVSNVRIKKLPDDSSQTAGILKADDMVQVLAFDISTYKDGIENNWFASDDVDYQSSQKYAAIIADGLDTEEILYVQYEYLTPLDNISLSQKIKWASKIWADAFCMRDGSILKRMSKDKEAFSQWDLVLDDSDNYIDFGYSSPWPWGSWYLSVPVSSDGSNARSAIRYYAETSDPAAWVWLQHLTYIPTMGSTFTSWINDTVIEYTSIETFDQITTLEAFTKAYGCLSGMEFFDFEGKGYTESIALQISQHSTPDYDVYQSPDTAAVAYLHLAGGSTQILSQDDTTATVRYTFAEGDFIDIPMYLVWKAPAVWSVQS